MGRAPAPASPASAVILTSNARRRQAAAQRLGPRSSDKERRRRRRAWRRPEHLRNHWCAAIAAARIHVPNRRFEDREALCCCLTAFAATDVRITALAAALAPLRRPCARSGSTSTRAGASARGPLARRAVRLRRDCSSSLSRWLPRAAAPRRARRRRGDLRRGGASWRRA